MCEEPVVCVYSLYANNTYNTKWRMYVQNFKKIRKHDGDVLPVNMVIPGMLPHAIVIAMQNWPQTLNTSVDRSVNVGFNYSLSSVSKIKLF